MDKLNIDPKKMALINEFQKISKGKSSDDLLPLVLAISKKAKSMGLTFSKEEMQMIVNAMKQDMSPQEASQVDMVMSMMSMMG